jgi:alkyldihydroxyacetonephosphate synthase
VEAERNFSVADAAVLLVFDEGDRLLVDAALAVAAEEASRDGAPADEGLVDRWLGHRNDVSQLRPLIEGGIVVDTFEITGPWGRLPDIYTAAVDAVAAVGGTLAVSAHLSHSYSDGACLYFTFGGKVDLADRDRYYRAVWDAGTRAVLAGGGSLSHHHGVGLNRARFMGEALGPAFDVLASVKQALDPRGVLNPGKLGLPSPFGPNPFAETTR